MLNSEEYRSVMVRMMKLRNEKIEKESDKNTRERKIKKTDFVVMAFLIDRLESEKIIELRQSTIAEVTGLSKSDVSKSISRLLNCNLIKKKESGFDRGYRIVIDDHD